MMKKIKIFIILTTNKIIQFMVSLLLFRSSQIIVMGLQLNLGKNKIKDYFMHNTKYLFLHLNNQKQKDFKVVWLTDDKLMQEKFKEKGFKNIYLRKSIKGIYYALRAKYWIYDNTKDTVYKNMSGNAIGINLWHGIPLKKIEYDMPKYSNLPTWQKNIFKFLRGKDNFYIVNSEYEQRCYETAFLTKKEDIKILGSPRLDVLLNDISNSNLFMEKDFKKIKEFKEQGKKLFFYTPTFRDTDKDISSWLKSQNLKNFLKNNNAILICKLHFVDKNSLNFELTEEFYKMDSDSDIYPVLKYSDALITDYSSIYFDYLLLDKPILYYPIDLEEYQEKCRGFYRPYDDLTAGVKAYNEDELVSAMNDVINGVDNYKEKRKLLRDKMFKYQDGRNCERVVEWIRSLDK